MKKLLFLLVATAITLTFGCSKDEDDSIKNPLVGTSWTAPDPVAEFIYGGTCTMTIEFLNETECQQIDEIQNGGFGSGTEIESGVYEVYGDSVKWTIDERVIKGKISGSAITTTMKIPYDGGYVIFRKN
jgi:hypothetical protein